MELANRRAHWNDDACRCFTNTRDSFLVQMVTHLMIASARPDVELWNVETRRLDGHFEIHTDSRGRRRCY